MAISVLTPGRVCKGVPTAVDRDTTILAATRLMSSLHVDCLVVTERFNGQPVSVATVTAGDIVTRVTAMELDPTVLTVGDIVWPERNAPASAESVTDVLGLFRLSPNHPFAVTDGDGNIVGVIPMQDLIPALIDELTTR
jgi:CBS domain-containing protein